MKLGSEERDDLRSLVDHEGWPVLLSVLEQLIDAMGKSVLEYNLETNGPNGLCSRKDKYAGARSIHTELLATVSNLKAKQKG